MATNKETLFDKTLNGSFWNAGVTFERTNPVPLEKYSIFKTLADAENYAKNNAVSYLGQIITVIGGEQTYSAWTFSDGGIHAAAWNGTKWTIDGTPCTDAKQLPESLSITTGTLTATRTIATPYDVANYKIVDTAGSLVQIDAVEIDPSRIQKASKEQYGVVKVGTGLDVEDGVISAQKLSVDQVIDNTTKTSSNPVATSAVVEYGKTAYDAKGTAKAFADALSDVYLPDTYLKKEVAESKASSGDKLVTGTTVDSKISAAIDKLDSNELTFNGLSNYSFEVLSSIEQVDGKVIYGKQKISLTSLTSDINGLKDRIKTAEDEISGLQEISSDHKYRIDTLEDNYTAFTTETFPAALTSLSNDLSAYAEQQAAAAKEAGELSAQRVRDDLTGYVQKTDVKTPITETNKVVTENEIKDLSGAMHFIGTATVRDGETPTQALIRTFPTAKKGDVAIITDSSAEYVYVGDTAAVEEDWHLIGDERTYATKAELEAHIDDVVKHITSSERADWNAKATSADVSAIADAYRVIEEQRATGIEAGLRSDIDEVSAQVSSFTNDWKSSVDLSAAALCAYAKDLSDAIGAEVERATQVEEDLSNEISTKIFIKDAASEQYKDGVYASSLSVIKVTEEEYMAKVADGTLLKDGVLYVVSADHMNAYGQQIVNVADPTADQDAATKKYVDTEVKKVADNALSAIEINGLEFEIVNNRATLEISSINGGNA